MPHDEREPDPNEGMGVSSERVGPTGPDQYGSTGVRDTSPVADEAEAPPEQAAGGAERNPDGLSPEADLPSLDPRSGDDQGATGTPRD